ncbi:Xaa-Pro peptidase family protein [Fodinicurvata sp. EGI_FJ10296]|uniref:M24 family metallopeptidase n=1 Tax=Fodinicurvata sp. EGI_FJ10296 TaxID=3231908 RepID=UPI003451AE7E
MTTAFDLPFSIEEYRSRVTAVQAEMARRGIDALLVHTPENIYYLTGYRTLGYYSYMMLVVPPEGDPVHLARFIEKSVLQGTSWVPNIETHPDTEHYLDATIRVLHDRGFDRGTLAVDHSAWYLTIADFNALKERLPDVKWQDSALMIETMRLIKSPAEQEYSRLAGRAASQGMRDAVEAIRDGITENEIMAAAYNGMFAMGSEFTALPPLINAGVRHTMAHATADGNAARWNEAVHLEIGASIKRYHAANLRVCHLGEPPKLFMDLTDLCRRSLEAGIAAMKPGVPAETVDHAARKVIDDAGYGDKFRHKAGYSIGIALPPDWSEARSFMLRGGEKRELQPGMVFHILPAVFEYKEYGIGLSETVLITDTGAEVLTNAEQKLFVKK